MSSTVGIYGQNIQENQYPYYFQSFENSAIDKINRDEYGQNLGWTMYKDIMFPSTTIYGSMKHLYQTNLDFRKSNRGIVEIIQ